MDTITITPNPDMRAVVLAAAGLSTVIRQANEVPDGPEISHALFCERHGMTEADRYHAEAQKPHGGLASAFEPQSTGTAVAVFDLVPPNMAGTIRFTRYPWSEDAQCAVCAVSR